MKEDPGYEAVMGITERRIASGVNREDMNRPDITGIDEIALKKGHNNSVTIITSYSDGRAKILGVVGGREKQTAEDFLSGIPERLRTGDRVVCCDMYEGYINAAGEVFGNKVIIVADRFHVAESYRKDSGSLRKQEMKRLKKELPEKEYGKLKGAMRALRKKDSELRSDGREIPRRLFRHSPLLKIGYELCDELTSIFNKPLSKGKAEREIGVWVEPVGLFGLTCFRKFLSTLKKRMEEISNYFIERQTGGFVEGFNNRIKVIKRRCYGIFNVRHSAAG
ncbi:MAG: hypothetical protein BWK80_23195 [Desulfobacteraceae bacterium IS3]|nr:MAG: hypothetical protein BWK80_23195 [Desulfobacteraceae bacterium IS3]